MSRRRRPAITARVVRGIPHIVAEMRGFLMADEDLSAKERRDAERALDYMADLAAWHTGEGERIRAAALQAQREARERAAEERAAWGTFDDGCAA